MVCQASCVSLPVFARAMTRIPMPPLLLLLLARGIPFGGTAGTESAERGCKNALNTNPRKLKTLQVWRGTCLRRGDSGRRGSGLVAVFFNFSWHKARLFQVKGPFRVLGISPRVPAFCQLLLLRRPARQKHDRSPSSFRNRAYSLLGGNPVEHYEIRLLHFVHHKELRAWLSVTVLTSYAF